MKKNRTKPYPDRTTISDDDVVRRLQNLADQRGIKRLSKLAATLCRERLDQIEYGLTPDGPVAVADKSLGEVVIRVKLEK